MVFEPSPDDLHLEKSRFEKANFIRRTVLDGIHYSIETMGYDKTVSKQLAVVNGNVKFLENVKNMAKNLREALLKKQDLKRKLKQSNFFFIY